MLVLFNLRLFHSIQNIIIDIAFDFYYFLDVLVAFILSGEVLFYLPFLCFFVKLRRVLQTSLIFIYSLCELGIMMSDRL